MIDAHFNVQCSCLFMIIRRKHLYPADVCPRCKGVVSELQKNYPFAK